jgi:UDP-N-acetylmuramoyl-tripeptide--D-alanyl-D-alanine ligase
MVEEAIGAGMRPEAAHFFEEPLAAGEFLRKTATPGDAILFKGSRGVKIERALEMLLA